VLDKLHSERFQTPVRSTQSCSTEGSYLASQSTTYASSWRTARSFGDDVRSECRAAIY